MSSPPLDVVTFGEAMGLFVAIDGRPLRHARTFDRQVAGAELNLAVAMARLGHRVGWFGRVGTDAAGDDVVRRLRVEGIDATRVLCDDDRPTGLLVRDHHGQRRVDVDYHRAGSAASALAVEDIDEAYLSQARLVHATGITPALSPSAREATRTALTAGRAAGAVTSLDPNVRRKLWSEDEARATLRELAVLADVVLAGADEAALISGRTGEAAADWFLERGARVVVVKEGALGAWATDGRRVVRHTPRPVTPVDPVGAGDAFDAGFLSAWLAGDDLERCLALGAAVGAACVMTVGDLDGLPTRREAESILRDIDEVDR
jgi:2-dehydro-3-deoxygluconokinase